MELLLDMILGISVSVGLGMVWVFLARRQPSPAPAAPEDEAARGLDHAFLGEWDWDDDTLPTAEAPVPELRDEMPPVEDLPATPVLESSARRLRGELRERAQRIDELQREVHSLASRFRSCIGRDPDSLQLLRGIGPGYERALAEHGIHTVTQLARMDVAAHRRMKRESPGLYKRLCRCQWVEQARALVEGRALVTS